MRILRRSVKSLYAFVVSILFAVVSMVHDLASPWERPQPARLHKIMAEGRLVWPLALALVVENFIKGHMDKQELSLLTKRSQASLKSQGSIRETCAWGMASAAWRH